MFNRKTLRISISKAVREYVMKRDRHSCKKCGSTQNLAIDHIKPLSKGGRNDISNFQVLCRRCNSSKGNRINPRMGDRF